MELLLFMLRECTSILLILGLLSDPAMASAKILRYSKVKYEQLTFCSIEERNLTLVFQISEYTRLTQNRVLRRKKKRKKKENSGWPQIWKENELFWLPSTLDVMLKFATKSSLCVILRCMASNCTSNHVRLPNFRSFQHS